MQENLQQPLLGQQGPPPQDVNNINGPAPNLAPAQPQTASNWGWCCYSFFGGWGALSSGYGLYDISQNDTTNGYFFFSFGVTLQLAVIRARLQTPRLQRITEYALAASVLFTGASWLNVVLGEQPLVHIPGLSLSSGEPRF